MGAGFYLMIATAVVMYKIAEADRRRGWLWFGITLCVVMVLGKTASLGVSSIFVGFLLTFSGMYAANFYRKSN